MINRGSRIRSTDMHQARSICGAAGPGSRYRSALVQSSNGKHFLPWDPSRRDLLGAAFVYLLTPGSADALTIGARTESLGLLPFQPAETVKVPRKTLDQRFAILLLRSTYEAVDALDYMPMDEFQKTFWLQRQAEWESYK